MTEIEFMRDFGINLKYELNESKMTQSDLAKDTGLLPSTISRYVNGELMPSLKNAINISVALGCNLTELVSTDDEMII